MHGKEPNRVKGPRGSFCDISRHPLMFEKARNRTLKGRAYIPRHGMLGLTKVTALSSVVTLIFDSSLRQLQRSPSLLCRHRYRPGTELQLVRRENGWLELLDPVTQERGWIFEKYLISIGAPSPTQAANCTRVSFGP